MDAILAVGLAVITGLLTPVLLQLLRAGQAIGGHWWMGLSESVASSASERSNQLQRGLEAASLASTNVLHRLARVVVKVRHRLSRSISAVRSGPVALRVRPRPVTRIRATLMSLGPGRWSPQARARRSIECSHCGRVCPSSALYCRTCGHATGS